MIKALLVVYGIGVLVTAAILLPAQTHRHDRLVNAASILLWPFYWLYFLSLLLIARKRS